jgi:hypothetical protein
MMVPIGQWGAKSSLLTELLADLLSEFRPEPM